VVLKWDDLKSALTNTVNDTLLSQQLVRIGHHSQTSNAGDVAG
jgi:hypothetical protein